MVGNARSGGEALLSVFEKIYVINLPSRADRRAEMTEQLGRIGLSLDHPDVILFDAVRPENKAEFPSIGTRGCYLSHLGVLEDALARDYGSFLVIEDDADFSVDFNARIESLAAQLNDRPWDIFYGWSPVTFHDAAEVGNTDLVVIAAEQGVIMLHFAGFKREAAVLAYPVLKAISERPMGDAIGGAMHVDGAYSWFRARNPLLTTLAAKYPLALQRSSRSDIQDLKWFDRIGLVRPLIAALRRLKHGLK